MSMTDMRLAKDMYGSFLKGDTIELLSVTVALARAPRYINKLQSGDLRNSCQQYGHSDNPVVQVPLLILFVK